MTEPNEHEAESQPESQVLSVRISKMTMAEKIKLALTGDREARGLLIRDANKLIQLAVAKNPRLGDTEVLQMAKMKTADQSVLRLLANDRKWSKLYLLKVELVRNPKTPRPLVFKLMPLLRDAELRQIAKGNDVLKDVSLQAVRMLSQKK